jgi:predicted dehydrogenase
LTETHQHKILEFGVIGFGKLGLLHSALANGLENCRLSAVVDPASTTLAVLKAQIPQVTTYGDHKELLRKQKTDGVFIAAPTHLHASIACDFIDAGVPVFIEKPLAANLEQAKSIYRKIRERPVPNLVGYMSRYVDTFRKAREIIQAGALGTLQTFNATMYIGQLFRKGKGWRYQQEISGGGVLITQNSHLVDLLCWYFGGVEWISAHTRRLYSSEVEDASHAYFVFKNGISGWMDTSWSARHHRVLTTTIHIQGENGTLDVSDDSVRVFLENSAAGLPAGWKEWQKPDLFQGVSLDVGGAHFTRQAEEFVGLIRSGGRAESSIESAYQVQAVIEAAYTSARKNGAPVRVEEIL